MSYPKSIRWSGSIASRGKFSGKTKPILDDKCEAQLQDGSAIRPNLNIRFMSPNVSKRRKSTQLCVQEDHLMQKQLVLKNELSESNYELHDRRSELVGTILSNSSKKRSREEEREIEEEAEDESEIVVDQAAIDNETDLIIELDRDPIDLFEQQGDMLLQKSFLLFDDEDFPSSPVRFQELESASSHAGDSPETIIAPNSEEDRKYIIGNKRVGTLNMHRISWTTNISSEDKSHLDYFCDRVVSIIITEGTIQAAEKFSAVLKRLSFFRPSVLGIIVALSMRHMSNNSDQTEYYSKSLRIRDKTIIALQNELLEGPDEASLASLFLQHLFDIFESGLQHFKVHFEGALNLIELLGGPKAISNRMDVRMWARLFCWYDAVSAIMTGRIPYFPSYLTDNISTMDDMNDNGVNLLTLVGCRQDISLIFRAIALLASRHGGLSAFEDPDQIAESTWIDIAKVAWQIESWSPRKKDPLFPLHQSSTHANNQQEESQKSSLLLAWKWGALVYIYGALYRRPCHDIELQKYVSKTLGEIIELGSCKISKQLLWPMFIAAAELPLEEEALWNFCVKRIHSLWEMYGLDIYVTAYDLLIEIRQRRKETCSEKNGKGARWWHIVQEKYDLGLGEVLLS